MKIRKSHAVNRFPTIKTALTAGFHEKRPQDYGGEEFVIKGHTLIRNSAEAVTMTEWGHRGFRPIKGTQPHATIRVHQYRRGHFEFDVYREDQVEPKRRHNPIPAQLILIAAAVWVINRRAKRCRDQADTAYCSRSHNLAQLRSQEKNDLYKLKEQAIEHLLREGTAVVTGHHRFAGENWAELIECEGYTFHRPCSPVEGVMPEDLAQIEAKPRGTKEPRLKDALHTIKEYLKDKPLLGVYQWPPRVRERAIDIEDRYDMEDRYECDEQNRKDDVRHYLETEGLELLPAK